MNWDEQWLQSVIEDAHRDAPAADRQLKEVVLDVDVVTAADGSKWVPFDAMLQAEKANQTLSARIEQLVPGSWWFAAGLIFGAGASRLIAAVLR